MSIQPLSELRWYTIFQLLSMKSVEPFLPEMGLDIANMLIIRPVAQRFVQRFYGRTGKKGNLGRYRRRLMENSFAKIALITDVKTADALYNWGTINFPYGGDEGAREFIWQVLLRRLAGLAAGGDSLVSLPFPQRRKQLLIRIVKEHIGDYLVLLKRVESSESGSLSKWEQYVCSTYATGCSPFDAVLNTIEYQRSRGAWKEIRSSFTDKELEVLLRWGKREAEHMGIQQDLIELPAGT